MKHIVLTKNEKEILKELDTRLLRLGFTKKVFNRKETSEGPGRIYLLVNKYHCRVEIRWFAHNKKWLVSFSIFDLRKQTNILNMKYKFISRNNIYKVKKMYKKFIRQFNAYNN